ncbi:MAG TPA: ABC transporter ATP-binding protein [Actinopolymorphaceae bacterium]|jgi:ABC-type Fe3+/spermidine/putrescine transport system ATPase subunit
MTDTRIRARQTATDPASVAAEVAANAGGLDLAGIRKVLGGRTIVDNLDLTVGRGELVCLLGPSGCGKTTTLRMIAGFIEPDAGTVSIADNDVTRLRPERRPTAMVFQSYALWPHMNVFDNVAFGLKLRKLGKSEIAQRVDAMLELVNLTHHARSRPARISGGEQQRVALARALVQRPSVLLLDEPLSNLDAKLRVRVREDIREIQQQLGITTVFVTHDQDEALSISDRVAVMNGGRIEQYSSPEELYRNPATLFVGSFVGSMNSFPGRVETIGSGYGVVIGDSGLPIPVDEVSSPVTDARTTVAVRPEDVVVIPAGGSADTSTPGTVERSIPRGHFAELVLGLGGGLTMRAFADKALEPGSEVGIRWRRALVYNGDTLAVDATTRPVADAAPRR